MRIMTAVVVLLLLLTSCGDETLREVAPTPETRPTASATNAPAPTIPPGSRIVIRPWTPAELPNQPPAEFADLVSRLSQLVEAQPAHFSGSWFDPSDGLMHLGVADQEGERLVAAAGLVEDPRLVLHHGVRNFKEGQRLLLGLINDPRLRGVVTDFNPSRQGDGFIIGINGDAVPYGALKALKRLPGTITLLTGLSGGEAGVGGQD